MPPWEAHERSLAASSCQTCSCHHGLFSAIANVDTKLIFPHCLFRSMKNVDGTNTTSTTFSHGKEIRFLTFSLFFIYQELVDNF